MAEVSERESVPEYEWYKRKPRVDGFGSGHRHVVVVGELTPNQLLQGEESNRLVVYKNG